MVFCDLSAEDSGGRQKVIPAFKQVTHFILHGKARNTCYFSLHYRKRTVSNSSGQWASSQLWPSPISTVKGIDIL